MDLSRFFFYLDPVVARQEDPPIFAVFGRLERSVATFDFHGDVLQRSAIAVGHEPADAAVGLADEADERLSVFAPVEWQLGRWRVLAAGHFNGDLHRSRPNVGIVLSPARQRVPGRSVGRPVGERRGAGLAGHTLIHGGVIAGVQRGQVMEDIVIRRL